MAKTEDQVRNMAEKTLGFADGELAVTQGTGQITTFNQLGFKGKSGKPDGWYLPKDKGKVANVLDAVPAGTLCAFILPDKKLEKDCGIKLLKRHTLETIVKMPEDV